MDSLDIDLHSDTYLTFFICWEKQNPTMRYQNIIKILSYVHMNKTR